MEPTDLKKEIGGWIKYVRTVKCDLTQDELAEETGINKQQISRYERGLSQPRQAIIDKIAEYGDLPFDQYVAEQKIPYETGSAQHKKLMESVREILESGNEKAIEALVANIDAFLEMIRISKGRNQGKGS